MLPSSATAQSVQDTDIFTAQFIPAYYGSAYDPTEAFKQMAGITVFVLAYDTFGSTVNNYVYKTQIKADGSIQAAGMPNASHYGVCVPISDTDSTKAFRPPIPGPNGDGLENSFAFKSASLPKPQSNPVDQFGAAADLSTVNKPGSNTGVYANDPSQWGCRTFLTSSRTVDIANHVNVFPLVPNSVLSVILNDSNNANDDFYRLNKPYEVYAQRIVVRNDNNLNNLGDLDSQYAACFLANASPDCITKADQNLNSQSILTTGPTIRGRTIPITQQNNQQPSNSPVLGTIFQAYAPRGYYAITYWRPDDSNPQTKVTYLDYDGSKSLNSTENGMAFEEVKYPNENNVLPDKTVSTTRLYTDWAYLAARDPRSAQGNAWQPHQGSLNIWGVISYSDDNHISRPVYGATVALDKSYMKLVNTTTRDAGCSTAGDGTGGGTASTPTTTTNAFGVYYFSSACSGAELANNTSAGISVKPVKIKGAKGTQTFFAPDNMMVSANGAQGPSSKSVNLTATASTGAAVTLLDAKGNPLALQNVDLKIDGRVLQKVAETDSQGHVVIPGIYLASGSSYTLLLSHNVQTFWGTNPEPLAFSFSSSQLNQPSLAMNDLGTIRLGQPGPLDNSFLAGMTLKNLMAKLNFASTAYAAGPSAATFYPSDVQIFFDPTSLQSYGPDFNLTNYSIDELWMTAPPEADLGSNYVEFIAYQPPNCDSAPAPCSDYGALTAGQDPTFKQSTTGTGDPLTTKSNLSSAPSETDQIVGLRLQAKLKNDDGNDIKYTYWDAMQKAYNLNPDSSNNLDFKLHAKFSIKPGAQSSNGQATSGSGQDPATGLPQTMQVDQDVIIGRLSSFDPGSGNWSDETAASSTVNTKASGGGTAGEQPSANFTISYDYLTLDIVPPSCGGGGSGGWSWNPLGDAAKIFNSVIGFFEAIPCRVVLAALGSVRWGMNIIADRFFTVDPLSNSYSGVVLGFWNVIRNFVNGLVVVILVMAGIAIMFRYEPKTFSLQSILTKLIITIILVNFSILIIQAVIDIANVLSFGGYHALVAVLDSATQGKGISASGALGGITAIAGLGVYIFALAAGTFGVGVLGLLLVILGLFVLLGYLLFRAAVDYYMRLAVLMICIILAPAAFAANILPSGHKYYEKWKNLVVGTLVSQVAFAFMLALSLGLMEYASRGQGFVSGVLTMLLAIGLFYYSTKVPAKAAAAFGAGLAAGGLASMATNAFSKAKSMAATGGSSIIKARRLSAQRDAALGVEGESWGTRFRARTGDSIGRTKNKYVRLSTLAGVNSEASDKIDEETYQQALHERELKHKREHGDVAEWEFLQKRKDDFEHQDTDTRERLIRMNPANSGSSAVTKWLTKQAEARGITSPTPEQLSALGAEIALHNRDWQREKGEKDKLAAVEGEVMYTNQESQNPEVLDKLREDKQEDLHKDFGRKSMRIGFNSPFDENRQMLNLLRIAPLGTRLNNSNGENIVLTDAAHEADFKKAIQYQMLGNSVLDNADRAQLAQDIWDKLQGKDFSTTESALRAIEALTVDEYNNFFKAAKIDTTGWGIEDKRNSFASAFVRAHAAYQDQGTQGTKHKNAAGELVDMTSADADWTTGDLTNRSQTRLAKLQSQTKSGARNVDLSAPQNTLSPRAQIDTEIANLEARSGTLTPAEQATLQSLHEQRIRTDARITTIRSEITRVENNIRATIAAGGTVSTFQKARLQRLRDEFRTITGNNP